MTMTGAEGGATGTQHHTNWLLWGGLGAGALVLFVLMKGGSSSSGTTAAGTSINAALGSIQEQVLNVMGQLGQTRSDILTQQQTDTNTIITQMQGMEGALTGELDAINQTIVAGNNSNAQGFQTLSDQLAQGLTSLSNSIGANSAQIQQLQANLDAARQQQNQYYNGLSGQLANLSAAQAAGLQGVNNAVIAAEKALYTQLVGIEYQNYGTATAVTAGANDPRVIQWLQQAQAIFGTVPAPS